MFAAFIEGIPSPQGSKKGFVINGRAVLVDASTGNKAWRETVRRGIVQHPDYVQHKGAVNVHLTFHMPKSKSNKKRQMTQKPDADKLARSVMDALTDSSLIEDDCRVVWLTIQKKWAEDKPGVFIVVWTSDDTPTT